MTAWALYFPKSPPSVQGTAGSGAGGSGCPLAAACVSATWRTNSGSFHNVKPVLDATSSLSTDTGLCGIGLLALFWAVSTGSDPVPARAAGAAGALTTNGVLPTGTGDLTDIGDVEGGTSDEYSLGRLGVV
ncbi:MAG: hypothetical protein NTZ17_18610 [Phycisphaerae bacterium]|nr:hypothetical protein [Phycisphaerae bacterium]